MNGSDYVDVIVRQWGRERPELDVSSMQILARIWRIERVTTNSAEQVWTRHGLSRGSFDVLAALRRSGAPYQLSPTELYQAVLVSSGAMTNRLDRLEEDGYVKRIPDPSDRRGLLVCLTDEGRALLDKALSEHVQNQRELLSGLSGKDQATLARLLRKLSSSLEATPDLAEPAVREARTRSRGRRGRSPSPAG